MADLIKKPNAKTSYTLEETDHLAKSSENPIYFIENFIKVQHPTKGSMPLILYPFQKRMVKAFHKYNKVVALTGRQLGKSLQFNSNIFKDGSQIKIGTLVKLRVRERIVTFLENILVKLSQ